MATKTTGREWKKFYSDKAFWPEGMYHEEEEISINGKIIGGDVDPEDVADDVIISVTGGAVYEPDKDEATYRRGDEYPDRCIASLEAYFRRWLKKQNTVTLLVEVGKDKEEAVKSVIAKASGKLVAGKR